MPEMYATKLKFLRICHRSLDLLPSFKLLCMRYLRRRKSKCAALHCKCKRKWRKINCLYTWNVIKCFAFKSEKSSTQRFVHWPSHWLHFFALCFAPFLFAQYWLFLHVRSLRASQSRSHLLLNIWINISVWMWCLLRKF